MSASAFKMTGINFTVARQLLDSIPLSDRNRISDECAKLKDLIDELDPSNPNYLTLSEHRTAVLEERVGTIFKDIELKLHPDCLRPSEMIKKQLEALDHLVDKLSILSAVELQKTVKNLHPDLKQKIYYAAWLASGAFKESGCGEEKLKKDPGILQRKFPQFFVTMEGTLLEQIGLDLRIELQRAVRKENIHSLQKISQDLGENVSAEEIRKEILALPERLQQALFEEATRLGLRGNICHSKIAILEDPNQLNAVRDILKPGDNIASQLADKERRSLDRLTKQRDDQKVAIFQTCLKEPKINPYQLQALFEALPESTKLRVPKPPYFGYGYHPKLYKTLGTHYDSEHRRTIFRVYAPHARDIRLNLTAWSHIEHSLCMDKKKGGVWEVATEHAQPGRSYHFMIVGKDGGVPFKKIDPFAFGNIIHSREKGNENHESMVRDIRKKFPWTDEGWMSHRVGIYPDKMPMAIYEIHPPTWKKQLNGDPLNWRALAPELAAYCIEMGYTHVELMALFEHPQPISMGYQITSFFALNSEMGSIEDLQHFVNDLHKQGIGVIADWVPAHFANDQFSLHLFDGSPLFEDDNPAFVGHPEWGTYEFDFKKQYTKDFLASNLNFLLKKFHFDGVRVDAVQSMLELNYGRPPGTRLNKHGNGINLDAKKFLRHVNRYIHSKYPGTLMIAEEAMGFPNLTRPETKKGVHTKKRGVDFDMTWHMGFVNQILENYFKIPPHLRKWHYSTFTKTVQEVDGNEDSRTRGKVVLPISHDENANGKGTVWTRMAGNSDPDKFANGRLLLAYQLLRGGGPILDFMGNEILQKEEWHYRLKKGLASEEERKKAAVQWEALDPSFDGSIYHRGARESRRALLHLYRNNSGLQDQTDAGLSWIDGNDSEHCVLSIHRRGNGQQFACVFNSSDKDLSDYKIPLPNASYAPELNRLIDVREVYNTDDTLFGGLGRKNTYVEIVRDPSTRRPTHLKLRLPPFTALLLEERFSSAWF